MEQSKNAMPVGSLLSSGVTDYEIIGVLGQGGFGITYLAFAEFKVGNVTIEGKFAIKEHFPSAFCMRGEDGDVLVYEGKMDEYFRSKDDFVAEARKLHVLGAKNDNIVKVNEVFEANGTAYYVMQYINGESLSSYVKKHGPMAYKDAINLLAPILDAVEFLHESRINHLDIKPDNIMLNESSKGVVTPVLVDFGLCMHFNAKGDLTSTKGVHGVSEGYSPLEQYVGISEFMPATDIYALMATLLFMLTGETPGSAAQIKLPLVREELMDMVPERVADAICHGLAMAYEDRTPNIAQLKEELGLKNRASEGVATVMINTSGKGKAVKPEKTEKMTVEIPGGDNNSTRRKWILIGVVAALIIATAIVLPLTLGHGGGSKKGTSQAESASVTDTSRAQDSLQETLEEGLAGAGEMEKPEPDRNLRENTNGKAEEYIPEPTVNSYTYGINQGTQESDNSNTGSNSNDNTIYNAVEVPASFPGGQQALMKWLSGNLRYPQESQLSGTQGKVVVKFVVNKDGSISNAQVAKGVDPYLDAEALRVVNRMPTWSPATIEGQYVNSYYWLPVTFRLQD